MDERQKAKATELAGQYGARALQDIKDALTAWYECAKALEFDNPELTAEAAASYLAGCMYAQLAVGHARFAARCALMALGR